MGEQLPKTSENTGYVPGRIGRKLLGALGISILAMPVAGGVLGWHTENDRNREAAVEAARLRRCAAALGDYGAESTVLFSELPAAAQISCGFTAEIKRINGSNHYTSLRFGSVEKVTDMQVTPPRQDELLEAARTAEVDAVDFNKVMVTEGVGLGVVASFTLVMTGGAILQNRIDKFHATMPHEQADGMPAR